MQPAVQHGPLRRKENEFLQRLKIMFEVYGAALEKSITSNPRDSPLDKQGRNCRQLHWPFLLPLVEIAGSKWYLHSLGQRSGCRSGLCRCLEPAEYGDREVCFTWPCSLLPLAQASSAHLSPFSTTKILLSVKRQLCMGHIQVVEGYSVLSTGWTIWWLLLQYTNSSFILFCQCYEAYHLTFRSPFLFYQLKRP